MTQPTHPHLSDEQKVVRQPNVDDLAQQIRRLNGNGKMGAGMLAEKLLEWLVTSPATVNEQKAEAALRQVLEAVNAYHLPDGIDAKEAMRRIIGIVDPWPVDEQKTGKTCYHQGFGGTCIHCGAPFHGYATPPAAAEAQVVRFRPALTYEGGLTGATMIESERGEWVRFAAQPKADSTEPIDMVLHCPKCHTQHIDAPDERTSNWKNEPHRSHLCHECGFIWRPADVPTNGVAAIKTRGKADGPSTEEGEASDAEFIRAVTRNPAQESKAYSDGTTATGPAPLPEVSPSQQGALADLDALEAMHGRNGPTIRIRAALAPVNPASAQAGEVSDREIASVFEQRRHIVHDIALARAILALRPKAQPLTLRVRTTDDPDSAVVAYYGKTPMVVASPTKGEGNG